jgi:hypothetical protein
VTSGFSVGPGGAACRGHGSTVSPYPGTGCKPGEQPISAECSTSSFSPVLRGLGGGRILGATIVASRAGEMIHQPTLAMATHMFTGRLAEIGRVARGGRRCPRVPYVPAQALAA